MKASLLTLDIDRRGTVEQLAAALEDRILDGELAPGTPLKESRLAAELELSRSSVREAIRGLVSTGLVDHRPHRGFAVTVPNAEDVVDLYRVRAALESTAARAPFAALRPRVEGLEEVLERLVDSQRREDWAGLFRAHCRFHVGFVAALGSRRIEQILRRTFGELRLAMTRVERKRPRVEQMRDEHRVLIDCIRDEDRRGLVRETRQHLETGERRVLEQLGEKPASERQEDSE